jgi:predicted RNA-binding Zn ribbon-like protein
VQAFINSHYDLEREHGAELLASPGALREWLVRHELLGRSAGRLGAEDLVRALAVREGLRALARANNRDELDGVEVALAGLNAAAAGGVIELRFGTERPRFVRAQRDGFDAALGMLLAITAEAMILGSWSRLKICPGHDCGWAFYDHSRNRSGRWCSMSVCGGRAKAQAHYRRHRGEVD